MPVSAAPMGEKVAAWWWAKVWRGLQGALAGWHLFSLDAPTVATLWTAAVARGAGVRLPAAGLAAMFLAVWVIYAGDRLLDADPIRAAGPGMTAELEPRHLFHHRHRRFFVAGLAAAAAALFWLLLVRGALLPRELRLQMLLGVLLGGYFLLIHAPLPRGMARARRLPKEIAVGVFFAAAVFTPTLARGPQLSWRLLPVALLFAALCSLNCAAIYRWEHTQRAPGEHSRCGESPAHPLTCFVVRHLRGLLGALVCGGLALMAGSAEPGSCAAVALAAGLLLLLDRVHGHVRPVTLRALGDLVLVTPLLLWPLLR